MTFYEDYDATCSTREMRRGDDMRERERERERERDLHLALSIPPCTHTHTHIPPLVFLMAFFTVWSLHSRYPLFQHDLTTYPAHHRYYLPPPPHNNNRACVVCWTWCVVLAPCFLGLYIPHVVGLYFWSGGFFCSGCGVVWGWLFAWMDGWAGPWVDGGTDGWMGWGALGIFAWHWDGCLYHPFYGCRARVGGVRRSR
ncbi:hypothetical protein QBC39DRAFT_139302 [Podospora conica]|nr:hypothetical protein QBC39DRAFT_139302 [Schizothecium conicum]